MSKQTPVKGKQSRNSRHDPRVRKAIRAQRAAWKLLTPEEQMESVRAAFAALPPIGKAPHATH